MDNVSLDERLAQMSREVREELAQGKDLAGDFFCRMGKLMIEQLLKAEVSDKLGRQRCERRETGEVGFRNGYKSRALRTGEGKIELEVPQVRGLEEPYRSEIWQGLGRRSVSLEKLATEMYARGLSTRDIEDLLKELSEDGQTMLLSKSAVSEVTG
jgi:transposase-like protein